jgi:hypothetical protein
MKRMLVCFAPVISLAMCLPATAQYAPYGGAASSALPLPEFNAPSMLPRSAAMNDVYGSPIARTAYTPETITPPNVVHQPQSVAQPHAAATAGSCPQEDYLQGMSQPWSEAAVGGGSCPDTYTGSGYGSADCGYVTAPCCTDRWFAGAYALWLTRDNENEQYFSYETASIADQLLNSNDLNFDYSTGLDVRFGRTFGCGRYALEAVYWGVVPGRLPPRSSAPTPATLPVCTI